MKTILSSQVVQKQTVNWICSTGHNLPTPVLDNCDYTFSALHLSYPLRCLTRICSLLLLLLSRFSRVRLCATPQTAAHQASPSLGFSGKNTGVDCHFLLQESERESEVTQSCLIPSDPMDAACQDPPSMGCSRQDYWSGES